VIGARRTVAARALAVLAVAWAAPAASAGDAALPDAVRRGEAVLRAAGGCTCHTNYPGEGDDAPELAGGRGLATPFGTFYSTNITPHRETGIGAWSDADFLRAMTEGRAPDGSHYFPVFPYPAFASMTERDLLDLKAYLTSLAPVERENREPDAPLPFRIRAGVLGWKLLNFDPQPFRPDPAKSDAWNRGAYLVNGPATRRAPSRAGSTARAGSRAPGRARKVSSRPTSRPTRKRASVTGRPWISRGTWRRASSPTATTPRGSWPR